MQWKHWIKSKTLWTSVLLAGLGALEMNINVIPSEYQGHTLIVTAMLMAVLRYVTTLPLDEK